MKVLLQARTDAYTQYGGDTYQFEQYLKYSASMGCELSITTELRPNLQGYDLYHVNQLDAPYPLYLQIRRAKRYGIPIALMPIHHADRYIRLYYEWLRKQKFRYAPLVYRRPKEWAKLVLRREFNLVRSLPLLRPIADLQKFCLENADIVLTLAKAEEDEIRTYLTSNLPPVRVVPNGANVSEGNGVNGNFDHLPQLPDEFGVVVGRIEPRKNQLMVLQAIEGLGFPFVFMGGINRLHKWYGQTFQEVIGRTPHAFYLGQLSPDTVREVELRALISVLASWFEVVSLASLDSFARGSRIVTTERSYSQEYYSDRVSYCSPDSVESIRKAILERLDRPSDKVVVGEFRQRYSWQASTRILVNAYHHVLGND